MPDLEGECWSNSHLAGNEGYKGKGGYKFKSKINKYKKLQTPGLFSSKKNCGITLRAARQKREKTKCSKLYRCEEFF